MLKKLWVLLFSKEGLSVDPSHEQLSAYNARVNKEPWNHSYTAISDVLHRVLLGRQLLDVLSLTYPDYQWNVTPLFDHLVISRYRVTEGYREYHLYYWNVDPLIDTLRKEDF